jgi:hypothetical protein
MLLFYAYCLLRKVVYALKMIRGLLYDEFNAAAWYLAQQLGCIQMQLLDKVGFQSAYRQGL